MLPIKLSGSSRERSVCLDASSLKAARACGHEETERDRSDLNVTLSVDEHAVKNERSQREKKRKHIQGEHASRGGQADE